MTTKTKTSIFSKIGNLLLTLLLIFLALLIAVLLYGKISGKNLLSYSFLWVLSPSMEDTIPARSYILVKACSAEDVKVGDVITFISTDPDLAGALNTHRVTEILGEGTEFVTKGDHNRIEDAYRVPAENVVSKYVCNLPLITFFGRVFATKTGFLLLTSVILIITFLWFRFYLFRAEKADRQAEIDRLVEEEVARLTREALEHKKNH